MEGHLCPGADHEAPQQGATPTQVPRPQERRQLLAAQARHRLEQQWAAERGEDVVVAAPCLPIAQAGRVGRVGRGVQRIERYVATARAQLAQRGPRDFAGWAVRRLIFKWQSRPAWGDEAFAVSRLTTRRSSTARRRAEQSARLTVALHTSSRASAQSVFAGRLLAAGLRELGHEVIAADERSVVGHRGDVRIFVDPHNFLHTVHRATLCGATSRDNLVLVNADPQASEDFDGANLAYSQDAIVWDTDYSNSLRLRRRGMNVEYLPLGFTEQFEPLARRASLPWNYGTCWLEPEVSGRLPDARLSPRPFDAAFLGEGTDRQLQFLVGAARELARHRCYLHMPGKFAPQTPDALGPIDRATIAGIAQRSSIVLHVHREFHPTYVWPQIVLNGIWQGALVISEPGAQIPPFRPGIDYVEAPLAEFPSRVNFYLGTEAGRRQAADITRRASGTLLQQCQLTAILEILLERFSTAAARQPSRSRRPLAAAA